MFMSRAILCFKLGACGKESMRLFFILFILFYSGFSGASFFREGDRVWINMYTDNLSKDSYAIGTVKRMADNGDIWVALNTVDIGEDRTLVGTCKVFDDPALSGVESIASFKPQLGLVMRYKAEEIEEYLQGRHVFLLRENLATLIQRWFSDAFGLSSPLLRESSKIASSLGIPHVAEGFELMALTEEVFGNGMGFPSPLEQRMARVSEGLINIRQVLENNELAYSQVLMHHGKKGIDEGLDLPARVVLHFLQKVKQDIQALELEDALALNAEQSTGGFSAIYPSIVNLLTRDGSLLYKGKSQQAWLAQDDLMWPRLL